MCLHAWNKLIAVSSALAGAGVLACAAAILDVSMPKASLAAFLARMALIGLAVTTVMLAFNWVCDKCESYFHGQVDRLLSKGQPETSRRIAVKKEQELWTLRFGYRP